MGRKLEILLCRSSRRTAKLKTLLSLTVSRLAVLRNQHQARCSHARSDVVQLLHLAQEERALLRSEQVIKEQNILDAFVIIEGYCHLVTERSALFERIKECPDELREAISGLVFAASRCGELPELLKVRYTFASKFGKEFTSAAVELRNNCGVNAKLIQKLSTRQPSIETKIRVTKEIAAEKGIKLDLEEPPAIEILQVDQDFVQKNNQSKLVNLNLSGLDLYDELSASGNQPQYKDVATAAEAAFKSAAYAAAAARAAVELSKIESQPKDSDDDEDQNASDGGGSTGAVEREMNDKEASAPNSKIGPEQRRMIQSNKPTSLDKSPSTSSSGSIDLYEPTFVASSIELDSTRISRKGSVLDKSEDDARRGFDEPNHFDVLPDERLPIKHKPSYLRPPYRKANPAGHGYNLPKTSDDEINKAGLGSRIVDEHGSFYHTKKLNALRPSVDQKPVSMRTRRGF